MNEAIAATGTTTASQLGSMVRIPGVFRRSEIEEVLVPGAGFHVEHAGALPPGTDLFYVYRELVEVDGAPTFQDEVPSSPAPASGMHPGELPRLRSSDGGDRSEVEPPSLGELKARYREEHLCLKCNHHQVCGMAKSLDPNLLVVIANCLGFDPDACDDVDGVCELTPIEPLTTT